MALMIIFILVCIGAYSLVILFFAGRIQQREMVPGMKSKQSARVSVIIPFRNEEAHLSLLINDLKNQSYPSGLWEVIWVNDHSTDGSGEIAESMISGITGFKYLIMPPGSKGKKAALAFGIHHASHERLIQVDADCRVGSQFIASHMAFLEKYPADLVAGLVSTYSARPKFLEVFERLDLLALAGVGAGSFGIGRPMMCSGANLSYSRELYLETRSYDPSETTESGDDMFLMIGARKMSRTLAYNTSHESCSLTSPAPTFRHLVAQRIRWGAKSTRYGMADIQCLALLVTLTNLSIFLMPLWFFLFRGEWWWLAGSWGFKSLADFVLLYRISGLIHQRDNLAWFIPVSLAYYPVFFLSLLGILWGKGAWKK
jgi:biofilm PGA synthesis N-glycosyltransferase PgaC